MNEELKLEIEGLRELCLSHPVGELVELIIFYAFENHALKKRLERLQGGETSQ